MGTRTNLHRTFRLFVLLNICLSFPIFVLANSNVSNNGNSTKNTLNVTSNVTISNHSHRLVTSQHLSSSTLAASVALLIKDSGLKSYARIESVASGLFADDVSNNNTNVAEDFTTVRPPTTTTTSTSTTTTTTPRTTTTTRSLLLNWSSSKKSRDVRRTNPSSSSAGRSGSENKVIRKEDLTDDLGTWEAPLWMQKQYPYFLAGHDDEDRPIWMGEIGKFNFRKIVEEGGETMATFDKYIQQAAYRVVKSMEEREVSEAVYLVDMDGLEFVQLAHVPTVAYVLKLARSYRELVVAHLGGGIIVNANFLAETLINILRPILSRALEKVEIYGTNKAKWLPVVLRKYPRASLPPWYGGYTTFQPLKVYG